MFGFGLVDPGRLVADVQQAETLGFDMVSFPDHLHGERPSVEPWTALTWAAAATERIAVIPVVRRQTAALGLVAPVNAGVRYDRC